MNIGIDKIGFFVPPTALDMETLAVARGVEPAKYTIGIGQSTMAVAPVTQDIVTLAANAALSIIDDADRESIDMILFGTGVDQSKSAAVYMQRMLGLSNRVRSVELKHACYGATAALQLAKGHIALNPSSKVLVIASDIAKYGIKASGESTQGAGSCAMLITSNPRILELNNDNVCLTRDVMDFWRPNYSQYAFVEGKFSTEQYLGCLTTTWDKYLEKNNKQLSDFDAICLHLPYPKLGLKGLNTLLETEADDAIKEKLSERFNESILYSQRVGNIYTGSLFLGLLSLLENSTNLNPGDKIALYSYGSGAVAEIFSMTLVPEYEIQLKQNRFDEFNSRTRISIEEYEEMFFRDTTVDNEGNLDISDIKDDSRFVLEKIENHKRIYKKQF